MRKYETDLIIQQLIETNQKLTDQLGNLWDEVGYKNDRVRDLTYEVSELKTENKQLKYKWKKCIADKWTRGEDQETKDAELERLHKILNDERTDN